MQTLDINYITAENVDDADQHSFSYTQSHKSCLLEE